MPDARRRRPSASLDARRCSATGAFCRSAGNSRSAAKIQGLIVHREGKRPLARAGSECCFRRGERALLARQAGFGLPLGLGLAQALAPFGAIGERDPRRLGPLASLAHVGKRRGLRIGARLCGARPVKSRLELRITGPDKFIRLPGRWPPGLAGRRLRPHRPRPAGCRPPSCRGGLPRGRTQRAGSR